MKIRRILATAVVATVTTPAVFLSVTPAFAAGAPGAPAPQTQQTTPAKPSIEELEKAVAKAKKTYEEALADESAAVKARDAAFADDAPLALAADDARKAAKAAAEAKTSADNALTAANNHLLTLPATATPEEKAAAEKAVADAQEAVKVAESAKTEADKKATAAADARDDQRIATLQAATAAETARKDAEKALKAAEKALADAKEEEGDGEEGSCVPEPRLTTTLTGLPGKVVAGTTVDFTLRMTNGTERTLDKVWPFASVHAFDKKGLKDLDKLLHLQWSSTSSPVWKPVDEKHPIDAVNKLKAGAHADFKLRLKVDASAPAGQGMAFLAGDYANDDLSCGGSPELTEYVFQLQAAGTKPGKVEDAKPRPKPGTSNTTAQGGQSTQPVNTTNGSLANTGSSDVVPQIALAGGAAVVLGAGAMVVVRRRKAGTNA